MRKFIPSLWLGGLLLAQPDPALAYIGPGAGLGAIGLLVAVVVAMFLVFVGFVWFPLRRFLNRRRAQAGAAPDASETSES